MGEGEGDVEALIVSEKVVEDWGVYGAFEIWGQFLCAIQAWSRKTKKDSERLVAAFSLFGYVYVYLSPRVSKQRNGSHHRRAESYSNLTDQVRTANLLHIPEPSSISINHALSFSPEDSCPIEVYYILSPRFKISTTYMDNRNHHLRRADDPQAKQHFVSIHMAQRLLPISGMYSPINQAETSPYIRCPHVHCARDGRWCPGY